MKWYPPDDYTPIRGVAAYILNMEKPAPESAEEKLLEMITEWKSPRDVSMTPQMGRSLIDRRLVPTAFYPSILAISLDRLSK